MDRHIDDQQFIALGHGFNETNQGAVLNQQVEAMRAKRAAIVGAHRLRRTRRHALPAGIGREDQRADLIDIFKNRAAPAGMRSEEPTSELQSLMRISYAVLCLIKKTQNPNYNLYDPHP